MYPYIEIKYFRNSAIIFLHQQYELYHLQLTYFFQCSRANLFEPPFFLHSKQHKREGSLEINFFWFTFTVCVLQFCTQSRRPTQNTLKQCTKSTRRFSCRVYMSGLKQSIQQTGTAVRWKVPHESQTMERLPQSANNTESGRDRCICILIQYIRILVLNSTVQF